MGIARDGIPAYFEKKGPRTKYAQPRIADPGTRAKVRSKLEQVLKRHYMLRTRASKKFNFDLKKLSQMSCTES